MNQKYLKQITLLALFGLIDAQNIAIDSFPIKGTIQKGYEPMVQEYLRIAEDGFDTRSQLAIYIGDQLIVDLYCDKKGDYSPDSLQTVFSSGKSVAAILMGIMADQGRLRWDAPVTDYWPEFGQNGKGWTRVEDVMRHEAGMPALSTVIPLRSASTRNIKDNVMGDIIAKDTQMWFTQKKADNVEGEVERTYHALTRDLIANEIFRRVEPSGRTMAEYLKQEFPDMDVYSGLEDYQLQNRVQDLRKYDGDKNAFESAMKNMEWYEKADKSRLGREVQEDEKPQMVSNIEELQKRSGNTFSTVEKDKGADLGMDWANAREWRAAEILSGNISASARGLAKLGSYMAQKGTSQGRSIMSERSWNEFHADPTEEVDQLFQFTSTFAKGGVAGGQDEVAEEYVTDEFMLMMSRWTAGFWGWMGFGGSIFQWNPEQQISFAYVPSDLMPESDPMNSRGMRLMGLVSSLARDNDLRSIAEYDHMDDARKAKFDRNLRQDKEETYNACKQDFKSIRCENSREIRKSNELARVNSDYYFGMGPEEQREFDMTLGAQKLIATVATLFTASYFM